VKVIEKIAARGGLKHLGALAKRVIRGEKTTSGMWIMGKRFDKPIRVKLDRKKELAKLFHAAKRETKKGIKSRPGLAGAAVAGGGTLAGYGLGRRHERKKKKADG
jgi:hypothetical protein